MKLHFSKYQGTGNDFILIDDRENKIHFNGNEIKQLCDRRFGIGGDGLIFLRNLDGFDFQMVYYNADGNESSMCGNGGRCITTFAQKLNKINKEAIFSAIDGSHQSIVTSQLPMVVKLKMGDVPKVNDQKDFILLDTGSPHYVKFVDDVAAIHVAEVQIETRVPLPFPFDMIALQVANLVDRRTKAGRTDHRAIRAGQTAGGDFGPARMFQI